MCLSTMLRYPVWVEKVHDPGAVTRGHQMVSMNSASEPRGNGMPLQELGASIEDLVTAFVTGHF